MEQQILWNDLFQVNHDHKTALMAACNLGNNYDIVQILIRHCPTLVNHPIHPTLPSSKQLLSLIGSSVPSLPILKLLIESGHQYSWSLVETLRDRWDASSEYKVYCDTVLLQPGPLQRLCRGVIRDRLQTSLYRKVYHLPIPARFKEALMLQHIYVPS